MFVIENLHRCSSLAHFKLGCCFGPIVRFSSQLSGSLFLVSARMERRVPELYFDIGPGRMEGVPLFADGISGYGSRVVDFCLSQGNTMLALMHCAGAGRARAHTVYTSKMWELDQGIQMLRRDVRRMLADRIDL